MEPYGGKFSTPNINSLASKGTVFQKHFAAAPSSGMAVSCGMFTGLYAHELNRSNFEEVSNDKSFDSNLFTKLESKGYETHVLWGREFHYLAFLYSKVFSAKTNVHYTYGGAKEIEAQRHAWNRVKSENNTVEDHSNLPNIILDNITNILENSSKPAFLWLHCPHVFLPGQSYGSDIDIFDKLVGSIMSNFDFEIFLSADHGHMDCDKNLEVYGHHVYQGAVHIPLITPRIMRGFSGLSNKLYTFIRNNFRG